MLDTLRLASSTTLLAIVKAPLPVTSPEWVAFVLFAVFKTTASNIPVDITPETDVVATGIVAFVPSEDAITLEVVLLATDRLVVTFVTFAVLASISANNVLANFASVIWSSPMYAVFIVVPCQTPLLIVPTSVISKAFISALDWSEFVTLAVLASISSNNAGDKRPETLVVAKGITALLPSEDVIVLAAAEPVIPRLVVTLVFLAVLAAIAELIALANLSAVTASSASWVVSTPPAVIAILSALAVIPVPPITFRVASPLDAPPVIPAPATTDSISPAPVAPNLTQAPFHTFKSSVSVS